MSEVKWILLPRVIVAKILEFLTIYTYLKNRLVCNNWKNTIINRKSINMGSIHPISNILPLIFNNTILTNVTQLDVSMSNITDTTLLHLRKLVNLQKLDLSVNFKITSEGLFILFDLTNLIQLNLKMCDLTDDSLLFLKNLVNLQELNLSFNSKISSRGLLCLNSLINLQILNLERCYGITSLNQFTIFYNLEKLNISGCCNIKEEEEFKYLINLMHLKVLDVSHLDIKKTSLEYLGMLSQLTSLCLSECYLTDGISHLRMLKNLLHLDISGCSDISDYELSYLKVFTKLLTLDISKCSNIRDNGLYYLSMLENLEELILLHCNITNDAIIHLNKCEKLKKIDISHTQIKKHKLKDIRPGIFYKYL
jgi:hypothetical protein